MFTGRHYLKIAHDLITRETLIKWRQRIKGRGFHKDNPNTIEPNAVLNAFSFYHTEISPGSLGNPWAFWTNVRIDESQFNLDRREPDTSNSVKERSTLFVGGIAGVPSEAFFDGRVPFLAMTRSTAV